MLAAIHDAQMLSLGELEPLFPDVSRRSLQRDLKLLLDKGLIQEIGAAALTDPNRSYGSERRKRKPRSAARRKL